MVQAAELEYTPEEAIAEATIAEVSPTQEVPANETSLEVPRNNVLGKIQLKRGVERAKSSAAHSAMSGDTIDEGAGYQGQLNAEAKYNDVVYKLQTSPAQGEAELKQAMREAAEAQDETDDIAQDTIKEQIESIPSQPAVAAPRTDSQSKAHLAAKLLTNREGSFARTKETLEGENGISAQLDAIITEINNGDFGLQISREGGVKKDEPKKGFIKNFFQNRKRKKGNLDNKILTFNRLLKNERLLKDSLKQVEDLGAKDKSANISNPTSKPAYTQPQPIILPEVAKITRSDANATPGAIITGMTEAEYKKKKRKESNEPIIKFDRKTPLPRRADSLPPPPVAGLGREKTKEKRLPTQHELGQIKVTLSRLKDSGVDISPDGKKLLAVVSEKGHQNLFLYKIERLIDPNFDADPPFVPTHDPNTTIEAPFTVTRESALTDYKYARVSTPQWSHKGDQAAYSLTDRKGDTALRIIDDDGREILEIKEGHLLASPKWEPDDSAILYSSDHSGVSNIYRFSFSDSKITPVTHVLGGAFLPNLAPRSKRLYFQNYTHDGLRLVFTEWHSGMEREKPLPQITGTWRYNATLTKTRDASETKDVKSSTEPYSSKKNLTTQFWFVYAEEDEDDYAWGAITAGEDPLANHAYFATLTKGKYWYHQFSYTNDQWSQSTLSFSSSLLPRPYPGGLGLPSHWERRHDVSISSSRTIFDDISFSSSLLYSYQEPFDGEDFIELINAKLRQDLADQTTEPIESIPDPFNSTRDYFSSRTFVGKRWGLSASFGQYDSTHYPLSVSEEKGEGYSLNMTLYPGALGSNPDLRVINAKDYDKVYGEVQQSNPDSDTFTLSEERAIKSGLKEKTKRLSNDYLLLQGNYTRYIPLVLKHHAMKLETNAGYNLNQNESQALFVTKHSIPLRGYRKHLETAQAYVSETIEINMPLSHFYRGIGLLPFYYKQLHATIFHDYAYFEGSFNSSDAVVGDTLYYLRKITPGQTRRSFGTEFKLLTQLGYRYPVNLIVRFSYATDIKLVSGAEKEDPFWVELDYGLTF